MKTSNEIRQHLFDIEQCVADGKILLRAIYDQLDGATSAPPDLVENINCFATCIGRNLELVHQHMEHAQALVLKGGNHMMAAIEDVGLRQEGGAT